MNQRQKSHDVVSVFLFSKLIAKHHLNKYVKVEVLYFE